VTTFDAHRATATLRAFRRVNSANVLAVQALLDGVDATDAAAAAQQASPVDISALEPIPPLPSLDMMPATVRRLLEDMSVPIAGDERPVLIPSLLRTFAYDPCVLALLWSAPRPAVTSAVFRAQVASIGDRAARLARGLPLRVARVEEEDTLLILRRFAPTIPGMLVVGAMLETALAEVLEPSDGADTRAA
jgi:hypothetical protein